MDGDAGDADYDEVHTNAAYLRADESSDYGENRSDSGEEYESRQEVSPASVGLCCSTLLLTFHIVRASFLLCIVPSVTCL